MILQINDKYKIESDFGLNIVLKRLVKSKKPGKTRWEPVGYYPKLEQCLERVVDDTAIKSTSKDFPALLADIRAIKEEILAACKGVPMGVK